MFDLYDSTSGQHLTEITQKLMSKSRPGDVGLLRIFTVCVLGITIIVFSAKILPRFIFSYFVFGAKHNASRMMVIVLRIC